MTNEDIDFAQMDPVAKMMFVALLNESQKIQDYVGSLEQRVIERYCTDFIPHEKIEAIPAITLLNPIFRPKKDTISTRIGTGASFVYKNNTNESKIVLNYIPLFNTEAIPYSDITLVTHNRMTHMGKVTTVAVPHTNHLWLGIHTLMEPESLEGLTLLIKGTQGIAPRHVLNGLTDKKLDFATMHDMERISMAEPFDAQQSSEQFFSFIEAWETSLLNMDDACLIVITDTTANRDLFKPRPFPKAFQQWLEESELDFFTDNSIWLRLEFPENYVIPNRCEIIPNVFPVANVDLNTATLSTSSPVAKLKKQEDSFFLRVLETSTAAQKQGFGTNDSEFIIRDFDAACYHNADLYREVRNLYNHFLDDYYAFIEFNNIKDGEALKQLRVNINKLGKDTFDQHSKFKFDSGTYAMKKLTQTSQSSLTTVNYITTQGKNGNLPTIGEMMENKKIPALESKIPVMAKATCGSDKASPDERHEMLRYYALTNDRLYTKMDIEAFLRKEIMSRFGKDEFQRIFIKIGIEGAGGNTQLQRGLYIDIEFKDRKNYDKAATISLDKLLQQKIQHKSCIAMPIIITLKNLEE